MRKLKAVSDFEAIEFLVKIGAEPTDFEAFRAALCGLHSGIPPCCVAFYVKIIGPAWMLLPNNSHVKCPASMRNGLRTILLNYSKGWVGEYYRGIGYNTCPACRLKQKFVNGLAKCDCAGLDKAGWLERHAAALKLLKEKEKKLPKCKRCGKPEGRGIPLIFTSAYTKKPTKSALCTECYYDVMQSICMKKIFKLIKIKRKKGK